MPSINVRCFTNLDEYHYESWPTQFACAPSIGHYVQNRKGKRLKIVAITHTEHKDTGESYLYIELHR